MKFEDDSQNLRARLRVIQILAVLMITALGVRLYYLQIVKGSYYAERADQLLLPVAFDWLCVVNLPSPENHDHQRQQSQRPVEVS